MVSITHSHDYGSGRNHGEVCQGIYLKFLSKLMLAGAHSKYVWKRILRLVLCRSTAFTLGYTRTAIPGAACL